MTLVIFSAFSGSNPHQHNKNKTINSKTDLMTTLVSNNTKKAITIDKPNF
jgi:hypothetical protein